MLLDFLFLSLYNIFVRKRKFNVQNESYLKKAVKLAKQSGKDVPVGAIIVKDGKIIAQSFNKKEKENDVTAHAEILAIRDAEKILNNWHLDGCIMYVTLEPCPMCASAIINSRISEVYFGAYDNLYGALGSVIDMRNVFNSKLKVTGGIREEECSELLKNFWRNNGKS